MNAGRKNSSPVGSVLKTIAIINMI